MENENKLTSNDIKELRNADTLIFRTQAGISTLWAKRERGNFKSETSVSVSQARIHSYEKCQDIYDNPHLCVVLLNATLMPEIKTIMSLLRAGDVLSFKWVIDNVSDNHRMVNFTCDSLFLYVERAGKSKTQNFTFHIETCVCPKDSFARMYRFWDK